MSELLIELLCEEIPATMQKKAEIAYVDIFKKYFQKHEMNFDEVTTYVGPRRITIHVTGLDKQTKGKNISIKGPRCDANDAAIDGFCASNNITKSELIAKDIKGTSCYFYETSVPGQNTIKILEETLQEAIIDYIWPKSMYWGDYKIKWIRPIQNILCIFDGEVVPFKLGHLIANANTTGHRFMQSQTIKNDLITNFAYYKNFLEENFVILSHQERTDIIKQELEKKAADLNLTVKNDPGLLEEVAGLVEYPVVMLGTIDQKFLKLPSEILVSSMRAHQKYFSLFDANNNFAPYFLFVSNINPSDSNFVIQGNEKVLSARLSDALYFYNQDSKRTLESRIVDLDSVIFHAKLGSLKAKTERLETLVNFIDPRSYNALEAATICKSDILSEVVGEFPNLQGIIGYYYALNDGKNISVASALRDHYKPQGPSDSVPSGEGAILALADKIDSLCGLIIAGEKPTGSKDPYAVRRLALGIIRIILENNLHLDLIRLIEFSCALHLANAEEKITSSDFVSQIISFIQERVENYFKEHFASAFIKATLNLAIEPDLVITKTKIEAISKFLNNEKGASLVASYKRANNIITGKLYQGIIDEKLFTCTQETSLFASTESNIKKIDNFIKNKDFIHALETLSSMNDVIAQFFEHVMVIDKNPNIANNRLLLLNEVKNIFDKIADFGTL